MSPHTELQAKGPKMATYTKRHTSIIDMYLQLLL